MRIVKPYDDEAARHLAYLHGAGKRHPSDRRSLRRLWLGAAIIVSLAAVGLHLVSGLHLWQAGCFMGGIAAWVLVFIHLARADHLDAARLRGMEEAGRILHLCQDCVDLFRGLLAAKGLQGYFSQNYETTPEDYRILEAANTAFERAIVDDTYRETVIIPSLSQIIDRVAAKLQAEQAVDLDVRRLSQLPYSQEG